MNRELSLPAIAKPTRVRFGVLGFACSLSMITYLDRVCFGTVAPYVQREFGLSNDELGWIFTAFAFAYAAFEVPTGWLGDVYGPRKTLIRIVVWWSVFTALTGLVFPIPSLPWFAFTALFAVRFLFGIGEAGAYPNIAKAFHNWFPIQERGSAQGAVWMGGRLMGGLTPFIVAILLIQPLAGTSESVGWRHIFYLFGAIGCVWCVLFWWWFRDRPEDMAGVNPGELNLIRAGRTAADQQSHEGVPWGKILSNGNLWVLCLMYFCAAYGWYFNITWLPKFLTEKYEVSSERSGAIVFGLLAGAPLLVGSLACLTGGLLTDVFIRKTGNRKWGRRIFGIIGHSICSLCYVAAMFAPNVWIFVLAIAMAAFWNDMTMGASWASCIDIGRRYSGIVSGCMNTIGNLGGALAGQLTGRILGWFPTDSERGWQINFCLFAGVYAVAVILWMFFDSTKPIIRDEDDPHKEAIWQKQPDPVR